MIVASVFTTHIAIGLSECSSLGVWSCGGSLACGLEPLIREIKRKLSYMSRICVNNDLFKRSN